MIARSGNGCGGGHDDRGTAYDIAILWPPGRNPVVPAICHTQETAGAKWNDEIRAEVARIVVEGPENEFRPLGAREAASLVE